MTSNKVTKKIKQYFFVKSPDNNVKCPAFLMYFIVFGTNQLTTISTLQYYEGISTIIKDTFYSTSTIVEDMSKIHVQRWLLHCVNIYSRF